MITTLTKFVALTLIPASLGGPSTPESAPISSEGRPRVLILGDSISIGYTPIVRELLDDVADVYRPTRRDGKPENCQGTTYAMTDLERWLSIDGGRWDVIHFNFGLHDLKRIDPQTRGNSDDPDAPRQAELDVYERQLDAIAEVLQRTDATLIFATTTPVPLGDLRPHRDPEDARRYNDVARKIMERRGIAINDLHQFAEARLDEIQRPANVHFTPEGSAQLAEQVAQAIRRTLKPADATKP